MDGGGHQTEAGRRIPGRPWHGHHGRVDGALMAPVFGHGRLRLYLLKLLDEEPQHGYELIRLLRDRFLGMYAPSAGTIYPRLQRLEAEGLVTHDVVGGRKVYRLTDAGRDELHARLGELDSLEADIAESVRALAHQVGDEVRDTARELRSELGQTVADLRGTQAGRPAPVWSSFLSYLEQRGESRSAAAEAAPEPVEPAERAERAELAGSAERAEPGEPASAPAGPGDEQDFQRRLQDFRDQARDLVHDAVRASAEPPAPVTAARLAECTGVLADALARIREILTR